MVELFYQILHLILVVSLRKLLILTVLLLSLLAACTQATQFDPTLPMPTSAPLPSATLVLPSLELTITPTLPSSASPTLTSSPTPTSFPTHTPTPLPVFQAVLQPNVIPQRYINDVCQEIYLRWNSQNSQPGTVVVPIMFHSIARPDRTVSDDTSITEEYFHRFMEWARHLGYQTITSSQLAGFLTKNASIPTLSMMLIVDDRKRAEFYDTYFSPYYQKYGWTVTNAWISHPDTAAYLWRENEPFASSGMVDFQAHGVYHNTPIDLNVTEEYILNEITGSIRPIEQHFGARPIAFVWPRGLFTPEAVQIARQAGYQLGFTATSRGPLLFNWIPLGPQERAAGDPLMVLPRAWSTAAIASVEEGLRVSQSAQQFFAQLRPIELAYYQQYCSIYPSFTPH